jgi:hypothetical protein
MPAAQHGYVHLSSADKDASDETDEVDLQVQCLTGEGVTLRVPLSILGYDLRRLVSEKLPCKPGAKLAVYHGNAMLALDQALGEQGITKEVAVLSSAYIPTNLYTAFRYVQGIPNGVFNGHWDIPMFRPGCLKTVVINQHLPAKRSPVSWSYCAIAHFQTKPEIWHLV